MSSKFKSYAIAGALLVMIGLLLVVATKDAKAATAAGFPLDLQVSSTAAPGSVANGSILTVKVTIRSTSSAVIPRFQVGIPGTEAPITSSQRLTRPVNDLSFWTVTRLGKTPKTWTFKIQVKAPEGAQGPGLWCLSIVAAPSLLNGPPAWSAQEDLCYGVRI